MQALARLGLLLCFRIDAGTQCCGVVLGLQSGKVYHLFNILPAPAWQALSAGTSILQLALAYLCDAQGGTASGWSSAMASPRTATNPAMPSVCAARYWCYATTRPTGCTGSGMERVAPCCSACTGRLMCANTLIFNKYFLRATLV
jgi:hypothetical protein